MNEQNSEETKIDIAMESKRFEKFLFMGQLAREIPGAYGYKEFDKEGKPVYKDQEVQTAWRAWVARAEMHQRSWNAWSEKIEKKAAASAKKPHTVPISVQFSKAYIDGVMAYEHKEIKEHWKVVKTYLDDAKEGTGHE